MYTALSRIADEQQLEEFTTRLCDRVGPVPSQVEQLFDAMRLQWVAREIGFEKVSLKNNKLRGTFIADSASGYFQSDKFMMELNYVQCHQQRTRMKEGKKGLSFTFDRVSDISEAIALLEEFKKQV